MDTADGQARGPRARLLAKLSRVRVTSLTTPSCAPRQLTPQPAPRPRPPPPPPSPRSLATSCACNASPRDGCTTHPFGTPSPSLSFISSRRAAALCTAATTTRATRTAARCLGAHPARPRPGRRPVCSGACPIGTLPRHEWFAADTAGMVGGRRPAVGGVVLCYGGRWFPTQKELATATARRGSLQRSR